MNKTRPTTLFSLMLLCSTALTAQDAMRVHCNDGTELVVPVSQIDSVTFTGNAALPEDTQLTGCWLWGDKDAGYYELLTFNGDGSYTAYDNFFTYGYDTTTYGRYSWKGNMITLQSGGFGYQRIYRWFVTGLAAGALEVMTRMGQYTYYRLQTEVLYLSPDEPCNVLSEDDTIIFADGVIAGTDKDGRLKGLAQGTTYVLVLTKQDKVLAYKTVVK